MRARGRTDEERADRLNVTVRAQLAEDAARAVGHRAADADEHGLPARRARDVGLGRGRAARLLRVAGVCGRHRAGWLGTRTGQGGRG
jgi:hypothetical protein